MKKVFWVYVICFVYIYIYIIVSVCYNFLLYSCGHVVHAFFVCFIIYFNYACMHFIHYWNLNFYILSSKIILTWKLFPWIWNYEKYWIFFFIDGWSKKEYRVYQSIILIIKIKFIKNQLGNQMGDQWMNDILFGCIYWKRCIW